MQISLNFKNFDSSEALRSYVQSRLEKLDKLLDAPVEANVVLCVEKIRHIAEITLVGDKLNLHATEESESMYSSIDMATDKIKAQIKKSKEKVRERRPVSKNGIKSETLNAGDEDEEPESGSLNIIVQNIEYKPMDVEEAAMQFSSSKNSPFMVFTNSENGRVNVIYKLKGGNLGLVQPPS